MVEDNLEGVFMAMVNLDFSSVKSVEPLEEGIYELEITKVEEKVASSGNPMLTVEFTHEDRKIWENYVLIDKCLFKLKELFDALGIDTSEIVSMDVQDLVGATIKAKVIQDTYDDRILNRIKKILK